MSDVKDNVQTMIDKGNEMADAITKTVELLTTQMKELAELYNKAVFGPEVAARLKEQFEALNKALEPFQKFNPLLEQFKTMQPNVNLLKDMKSVMEKTQEEQIKLFQGTLKQFQEISPLFSQMEKFGNAFAPLEALSPMMDQMKQWQQTVIKMMNIPLNK